MPFPGFNNSEIFVHHYRICTGRKSVPASKVKEEGRLNEEKAQKIFRQLVSAFRYYHDHGIIHQDLKPQNILQDAEGNAELSDFGLATRSGAGTVLQGRCGTKSYNATELVLREG